MDILIDMFRVVCVFALPLTIVPILIYLERRIAAAIQSRIGPNRVGPFGLLQPLADAIKFIFKEDIIPSSVDRVLFVLAPLCVYLFPLLAFAVVPMGIPLRIGERMIPLQGADLEVGVLYFLSITSLGVYGIALGGWSSHNKYSLFGGIRASAQLISYEIPLGLSVLAVLMASGSPRLTDIVRGQFGAPDTIGYGAFWHWNCFHQPVAFVLFFIAALAENNRAPFDLPEAEAELVGGYHTEYSSMKFAMFFMGEYIAMIAMSALLVALFLGGWSHGVPGIGYGDGLLSTLVSFAVFWSKVMAVLLVYMWIRWTVPRFRYDQLMSLGWKALIPIGLLNLCVTAVIGVLEPGILGRAVAIAAGFGLLPWLFYRTFVEPPGADEPARGSRVHVPHAFGGTPAVSAAEPLPVRPIEPAAAPPTGGRA